MISRNFLWLFILCWISHPAAAQPEGEDRQRALEQIRQAYQLIEERRYEPAEVLFKEALPVFEAEGDCYHQAYCYLWLSEAAYGSRRPPAECMALAERGKAIADTCARRDDMPFYSLILQNLGVFSSQLGDFDRQMAYYRQSFEEVLRFDGRESRRGADAYQNLGVAYGYRGQWDQAIAYLDTSLLLSEQLNYDDGIATACHNLAYAFETKKDYIRAIDYQRRALSLSEDPVVIARGYNNLGTYYSDLGEFTAALGHLEESLRRREALFPPDDEEVLGSFLNIARAYFDYGYPEKAEAYVDQVIDRVRQGGDRNEEFLKLAYHYKANLLQRADRLAPAEDYIRRALAISSRDQRHDASTLLILAEVLAGRQRYDESLVQIQQALVYEVDGFAPASAYENPPLQRLQDFSRGLDLLRQKARILHLRGAARRSEQDLRESLATYGLADSLIAKSRRMLQHNASKESLAAAAHQLYAGAIAAAFSLYRLNGEAALVDLAFIYSEKNKAMLVLEKIHDLYAKNFHDIPSGLIERERQLLQDIEFYSTQLRYYRDYYPDQREQIESWEAILFELNRRQEGLLKKMRRDHPGYYQLKHDLASATPARVQRELLADDEVLVEYFASGERLYIFLVSPTEREWLEIPLPGSAAELVQDFQNALLEQAPDFFERSHTLYQLLLAPIADKVAGRSLIIVPDGALGYLPFEALLSEAVPPERQGDHRRLPYLIKRHGMRYYLSASLALEQSSFEQPDFRGEVLVMAPSFDGLPATRTDSTEEFRRLRGQLSPLPGSREEADLIRRYFHGTFLLEDAARESFFKRNGHRYKLIHLTTHTLIDERFPSLSKLVFAREGDSEEDGFLNIYELYNSPLNAELVVLSACNTGVGTIVKGEGIASLARAFTYAGSPNLVMSLWPVQNYVAPELMEGFYENLKAGKPKGEALRQAKLDFLEYGDDFFTHPYYWATFVYCGDREALALQSRAAILQKRLEPLLFILLGTVILVFGWARRGQLRG